MKSFEFTPRGVCSSKIKFSLDDDGMLRDIAFRGGCAGNLLAISKLCEGKSAKQTAELLKGNRCGMKNTSCADQFSKAIEQALKD